MLKRKVFFFKNKYLSLALGEIISNKDLYEKLSNKCHQLVEHCNSLHVSIDCVIQMIHFN